MDTIKSQVPDLLHERRRIRRSFEGAAVYFITLFAVADVTLWALADRSFAEEYSTKAATDLLAQEGSAEQAQPNREEGGQVEQGDIKSRGVQVPHPPYLPMQFQFRPNGAFACMQDNAQMRDLSGPMSQSPTMTNAQCRTQCKGGNFVFAGTQNGNQCFCGNTFGRYGPSNACTVGCTGYNGEICGGAMTNPANSVSLTGVAPFSSAGMPPVARPIIPPPPMNGGQCVIEITDNGYRHTEIQRWEAIGPSVPNTMGPGMLIPMNWTITGNGFSQQGSPGNEDVQIWTISGSRPVHSQLTVPNSSPGDLIFGPFESAVSITGTLQGTQQKWTNGMANPPGSIGNTRQEYPYGTAIPGGAQMNPIIEMTAPVDSFGGFLHAGVKNDVTCTWHVMR